MKRRDLLKFSVVWTTPVVMAVTLPAHAQTSNEPKEPPKDDPPRDDPPKDDPPEDDPPEDEPECEEKMYRIKSNDRLDGWESDPGVGANDCLASGEKADGSKFATISGDARKVTVTLTVDCGVYAASHKAGQGCVPGKVSGNTITFEAIDKDISHVELILECCE